MKGTIFSADFVKDNNGDLRLLEFNTDTGIISSSIPHIDFSPITSIISSSNISEVHVILKPSGTRLINLFSASVASDAPSVTTFTTTIEDSNAIYPTAVEDSGDKFILRQAYDEAAIFDSTYCANNVELLKLYDDNEDNDAVVQFRYDSANYSHNNIPVNVNSANIPDTVVKPASSAPGVLLEFHKIGGSGTLEENFNEYYNAVPTGSLIMPYYFDDNNTHAKSIRTFNILYGDNLDLVNVGAYEVDAVLEKPTSIAWDTSVSINKLDVKHYYEFATNSFKWKSGGVFEEEEIIREDGSSLRLSSASVGDIVHSYYVSGSPDTDDVNEYTNWSFPGENLPEGSYATSSVIINTTELSVKDNVINHVTVEEGKDFRIDSSMHVLAYDEDRDCLRYTCVADLEPNKFKLVNDSGSNYSIIGNDFEILDGDYNSYILDMEEADTFFIKAGVGVKLMTHNCFVAGTKITLANGDTVNIEDLKPGDKVKSVDLSNGWSIEDQELETISKTSANTTYKIITSTGSFRGTAQHPMYVEGNWIPLKGLKIGDKLKNIHSEEIEIVKIEKIDETVDVYNLINVSKNHNFFVWDFLAHNKAGPGPLTCFVAGTKITMADSSYKNIEEIVIGDEVLSFDDNNQKVTGKVTGIDHSHTIGSHADACKTLGHGPSAYYLNGDTSLQFTPEHPFKVDMGWASLVPDPEQEPYKTDGFTRVLKLGDKIFDTEKNNWIEITSIDNVEYPEDKPVYNITVDTYHNYTAGNKVVHNK